MCLARFPRSCLLDTLPRLQEESAFLRTGCRSNESRHYPRTRYHLLPCQTPPGWDERTVGPDNCMAASEESILGRSIWQGCIGADQSALLNLSNRSLLQRKSAYRLRLQAH